MIIYYIGFMTWILSLCSILTNLNKSNKNSSLLKAILLYNFFTGFFGYYVFFISSMLLFILVNNLIIFSIFNIIILLLLILPINIKVSKKININKIGYIALTIIILLLGFGSLLIFENHIVGLI